MSRGGVLQLLLIPWGWKCLRLLLSFSPRLSSFGNFVDGRYSRIRARSGGKNHEGGKKRAELLFLEAQVVVQKIQQLLFHEVDLSNVKHNSVVRPVNVLWRRIVQVFRSDDESGEKNPMACARHTCSPIVSYGLKMTDKGIQPFAIVGNFVLSLSRYTRVVSNVDTCTFEQRTRWMIKFSKVISGTAGPDSGVPSCFSGPANFTLTGV